MTAPFKRRAVDGERIAKAARDSLADTRSELIGYTVGQVYDVPIGKLKQNPANARALYSVSAGLELAKSIEERGQVASALAFLDEEDELVLIDGHRRLKACESLGHKTVRVEIRPNPDSIFNLYLASRTANEHAAQTPLDDAIVWKRLLEKKVVPTQVELAKQLGISESEVSRVLSLNEIPPPLTQAFIEKPELLGFKMLNALREYYQSQGLEKTMIFAIEVASKNMGYRDVEVSRKLLEREPIQRPRALKKEVAYKGFKGSLQNFEKDGRVVLTFTGLAAAEAQELAKKIEQAFKP